jgi:acyl carrier protein
MSSSLDGSVSAVPHHDDVERKIEAFLHGRVEGSIPGLARDVDLYEGGHVDSVGVIELLSFVEEEFGVLIPEEDLLSGDFSRISGIARIVARLLGEQPGAS